MSYSEDVVVSFSADTGGLRAAFAEMAKLSDQFGSAIAGALEGAVKGSKSLTDVLKGLALQLADIALKAALSPLKDLFSGMISGGLSGLGGLFGGSGGITGGLPIPFADGGVVSAPTYFPISGGRTGLMGEAGAEAILPLSRGSDGRLGVRAASGGGARITVNIQTPDVESFRRSEAQVAAMLARAVNRGSRAL